MQKLQAAQQQQQQQRPMQVSPSLASAGASTAATGVAGALAADSLFTNQQLNNLITNPYTNATHMFLLDLRQQLITRAIKFDEHFRSLLTQSKLSLHNMFVDTYGMIYEHNTEIFTSMYEDLEQYYATGRIKLTKSMENFFERLYQKIFQVYNSNRAFAPSYLECATEQLTQLKPFKDAPDKLIGDIRHAFVAARTFNQALNSGIDIIKSIISVSSSRLLWCLFSLACFQFSPWPAHWCRPWAVEGSATERCALGREESLCWRPGRRRKASMTNDLLVGHSRPAPRFVLIRSLGFDCDS